MLGTKNLHEILRFDTSGQQYFVMMFLMVDVHDDNDFDLHSDRDSISGSVQLLLDEATEPWGIKVFYSAIIVHHHHQ